MINLDKIRQKLKELEGLEFIKWIRNLTEYAKQTDYKI